MILPIGKKRCSNSGFIRPLRARAGFTLIELVLVIFLISILVALSTPLFKRTFTNLELKNASFNIAKIISYAREMAIVERANYRVNFDFEEGKIWITKLDPPDYKRIGGRYGRPFPFPDGVTVEAESEEITFYPDGRSDRAEISITDKNGKGYLLRIRGFDSQVKIEEINGG